MNGHSSQDTGQDPSVATAAERSDHLPAWVVEKGLGWPGFHCFAAAHEQLSCEAAWGSQLGLCWASHLLVPWPERTDFHNLPVGGSKFQASPAPSLGNVGYEIKLENSSDCGCSNTEVTSQYNFPGFRAFPFVYWVHFRVLYLGEMSKNKWIYARTCSKIGPPYLWNWWCDCISSNVSSSPLGFWGVSGKLLLRTDHWRRANIPADCRLHWHHPQKGISYCAD